ncbi:DUF6297 family protein [Pseudokineococcus sp. 1T1Z-3]|uniref:DUF6297 family protein n=1 Tax=Pseudokineococcus sp. 1T1Z-3 TaxID=3132745 RepID=UPI0030A065A0
MSEEPAGGVPEHLLRPVVDGPGTSARQLRADARRAARRASGATLGRLLSDVYSGVLGVATSLLLLAGVQGRLGALGGVAAPGEPPDGVSLPVEVLVVAALLLVLGGVVGLLARLGPLSLPPAQAVWWLPLPVSRGALLRPVVLRRALVTAVLAVGASVPVLLLLLPAGGGVVTPVVLVLSVAGLALVLVAVAGLVQATRGTAWPLVVLADALVLLAPLLVAAAALPGVVPVLAPVLGGGPSAALVLVPVLAALLAAVALALLGVRAGRVPAVSLTSAGALSSYVTGSGLLLDTRALGRALSAPPRTRRRRRSRVTRGRLVHGPVRALLLADVLAVLRSRRRVVTAAVLALVPAGAAAAAGDARVLVLVVLLVAGYGAATTLAEPVRERVLVPTLDATWPLTPGAAATAHLLALAMLTTTALAVAAGALAVLAPGSLPLTLVAASGPGLAAAALRGASRPELDPASAVVTTPAGPLPVGLLTSLTRGPDVAVVALLPLAVGALALGDGQQLRPVAEGTLVVLALLLGAGLGAVAASGARPPGPEGAGEGGRRPPQPAAEVTS